MNMEKEKPSSSEKKLERKSSLETEPKTLFEKELDSAREAALKVINSNTPEEALKIFLEGLHPIQAAVKATWEFKAADYEED